MENLKKYIEDKIYVFENTRINDFEKGIIWAYRDVLENIDLSKIEEKQFWKTCIIETIKSNPTKWCKDAVYDANYYLADYKKRFRK